MKTNSRRFRANLVKEIERAGYTKEDFIETSVAIDETYNHGRWGRGDLTAMADTVWLGKMDMEDIPAIFLATAISMDLDMNKVFSAHPDEIFDAIRKNDLDKAHLKEQADTLMSRLATLVESVRQLSLEMNDFYQRVNK